jgi:hypothetical protein
MSSWVEADPPPGWLVSKLERNHDRPDRPWWARCAGAARYGQTREQACRLAWERWALEVLGDLLRWRKCDETGFAWVDAGSGDAPFVDGSRTDGVYVVHSRHGTEFVEDTVEALARLAAITLGQLGPIGQNTEEKPVTEGGE